MKKKMLFMVAVLSAALLAVGCGEQKTEVKTTYVDDLSKYITLGEYKGLEYEEEVVEVTDEEIQAEFDYMAEAYAKQEQITEGTAKDGDIVNIDYAGYIDGEQFDGGTRAGFDLTLGSGMLIPGFEAGVVGMEAGETKSLNLTFPDPYSMNPELSGKAVVFEVTLNYILGEYVVPEITDQFIADNTEYNTVDEYREFLREAIGEYKTAMAEAAVEEKLWGQIMENSEVIELPEEKITEAAEGLYTSYKEYCEYYGMTLEDFLAQTGMTDEEFRVEMDVYAEDMVKRSLIFYSIIEAEDLAISEEEYTAHAEELAANYGYATVEELEAALTKETVEEDMLWTKVYTLIVDSAKPVAAE